MAKGPYLANIEPFIAAGIDPRTGLPRKMGSCAADLKDAVKKALRIRDEQDAVGRYEWTGLEKVGLTSRELEKRLYYKGQLCLFYLKELDKYYILPYALDGTIDLYGRFNSVHPVPFASGTDEKSQKSAAEYLSKLKLNVLYVKPEEQIEQPGDYCVLLHDYTKQLSETILPRQTVNDPILDVMAECIPYMKTRLMLSTGVKGVRVADADQADSVADGSRRLNSAALRGEAYIPIVGSIDFQDLSAESAAKSEEYMLAMQSLDNFRLSTHGITNGGLFEKKAHELQTEESRNAETSNMVLQDGLSIRQNFCELVNSLFGLNLSVKAVAQANESEAPEKTEDMNKAEEGGLSNEDDSGI